MTPDIPCIECGAETEKVDMEPGPEGATIRRCANGHYVVSFPDDRPDALLVTGESAEASS